jgi:Starch-binding associating with outer membrane
MKFLKYIKIFSCLLLLWAGACTKNFEDTNSNPNEPVSVSPQVVLPYAIREGVDRLHGHRTRLERLGLDGGMLWVQYLARNQYTNEGDTYNPDASMRVNNWRGFYVDAINNCQKVINISSARTGGFYNENFQAIGIIMREYFFSIVTDTWGAIPYDNALAAEAGNLAPAYTSQENVYIGMLKNLKIAAELIDPAKGAVQGDILFNGDLTRWRKFANSLRLRLANRMAAKKPAEARAVFAEILGNPAKYPVFTGNTDFAQLNHQTRLNGSNNNSWHETLVFNGREDWSISTTLIAAMTDGKGAATDPRLTVYGETAIAGAMKGKYSGCPNGLSEAAASPYINNASRPGKFFTRETGAAYLMTYSELLFIMAEAALDGDYTTGKTAKQYLDEAIAASFAQYNLTMPAGYTDDKMADKATIMTEKWKAMFSQGLEAWAEYRRTGFPVLPPAHPEAIFENQGKVPTRMRYPESEYSLNRANVEGGATLNGGPDTQLTKMWWAE